MNAIKKHRTKCDLSQYELADKVGISKGYMSKIENGVDICPAWLAEDIADALRCKIDTIFKPLVVQKTRRYTVRKV